MPRFSKYLTIYRNLEMKYKSMMLQAGVPDFDISFREIIYKVLGKPNVLKFNRSRLTLDKIQRIETMCLERIQRKPLQYVIGEWDFRQLTLHMRQPVFVPRPETEELVQLALSAIQLDQRVRNATTRILEVGCGSGAVTLSLLHECPEVECTAVDCNEAACKLTLDNAELCGLRSPRLKVHFCSLAPEGIFDPPVLNDSFFHVVVSNPPYIGTQEMEKLDPEISRYEDERALWGGQDGMAVIRSILSLCCGHTLLPGGVLLIEVGLNHPVLIRQLLAREPRLAPLKFQKAHKDFTGRERFVEISKES